MYFDVILFYDGDSIQKDELQKQIEALRGELRELSDSLAHLRQSDMRMVMGEQIRSVFAERIDRFFSDKKNLGSLTASEIEVCKLMLMDFLDAYISAYQQQGKVNALQRLDAFETRVHGMGSPLVRGKVLDFADALIEQLRSYMDVSDRVMQNRRHDEVDKPVTPTLRERARLSPVAVESALTPLSNSWRINILTILSADEDSLAGLSRTLGLKKGHLQFHLNVLLNAGLIDYGRKSHLYSITTKGTRALVGLEELVDALASA